MLTIRAMAGGAGYAQRYLEHSDYYDEQRRIQGEWHGRGAELFGLRGEVTREQFEAIREGLNPDAGEFLRPRHSADRATDDGTEQSKARKLAGRPITDPDVWAAVLATSPHQEILSNHIRLACSAGFAPEPFSYAGFRRTTAR